MHDHSLDAEKAFDKIQHPFMMKVLKHTGIQKTFMKIIKATNNNLIANMSNRENLKASPLKSRTRQG